MRMDESAYLNISTVDFAGSCLEAGTGASLEVFGPEPCGADAGR